MSTTYDVHIYDRGETSERSFRSELAAAAFLIGEAGGERGAPDNEEDAAADLADGMTIRVSIPELDYAISAFKVEAPRPPKPRDAWAAMERDREAEGWGR